jgi:argininosuccinate lyase
METYRTFSDLFDEDLYGEISLTTCVEKRISEGGTSVGSVRAQIEYVREQLA